MLLQYLKEAEEHVRKGAITELTLNALTLASCMSHQEEDENELDVGSVVESNSSDDNSDSSDGGGKIDSNGGFLDGQIDQRRQHPEVRAAKHRLQQLHSQALSACAEECERVRRILLTHLEYAEGRSAYMHVDLFQGGS